MSKLPTIDDLRLEPGTRVLVRVDFNVPLKDGKVVDDSRIQASLPLIKDLLQRKAVVILLSHLGRPDGKPAAEFRLDPVAAHLEKLLKRKVHKLDDCIGTAVEDSVNKLSAGDVCLLENLRFHAEEEKNDDAFAAALAELGEAYVNDAFGVSHRAHASVHAIVHHLPSAAGPLLLREAEMLSKLLGDVERPFIVVMGGAKVGDKIGVIKALAKRADAMLVGGAMGLTFLAALGRETGQSKVEKDKLDLAKALLHELQKKLVLPIDVTVARDGRKEVFAAVSDAIPKDAAAFDIGPQTAEAFGAMLADAKTVFWNGPLGLFEEAQFQAGTTAIAKAIAGLARQQRLTVVGGGDTVAAVQQLGLAAKFAHVSTGGGAALEFIEKGTLPGIEALRQQGG
jgi:phosphoglycerate kinase